MSANEVTVVLRAHAPRAPQALRARVLELEPPRAPRRKLILVVVPAAVAVAVAAAIVHALVSSGGGPKIAQRAAVHAAAPANKAYVRGAPGLPAISGSGTRLQHTEASLDLRVAKNDLSAATSRATRIATSLGGYAESVNYDGHIASLVLRVPAQNVKTALARLAGLGTILSQDISVTDLQHDFEAETAQISQLRRTVAALQAALRSPSLPDAQRVLLRIRLANAKTALAQALAARAGTITAGTTARISLTLTTESVIVPVPVHRGRLDRMVHSAVGFLGLEGTIVLYALIVLSPVALVAALLWSLREARRRRDERLVME
jgi:hypothetical protein